MPSLLNFCSNFTYRVRRTKLITWGAASVIRPTLCRQMAQAPNKDASMELSTRLCALHFEHQKLSIASPPPISSLQHSH